MFFSVFMTNIFHIICILPKNTVINAYTQIVYYIFSEIDILYCKLSTIIGFIFENYSLYG